MELKVIAAFICAHASITIDGRIDAMGIVPWVYCPPITPTLTNVVVQISGPANSEGLRVGLKVYDADHKQIGPSGYTTYRFNAAGIMNVVHPIPHGLLSAPGDYVARITLEDQPLIEMPILVLPHHPSPAQV